MIQTLPLPEDLTGGESNNFKIRIDSLQLCDQTSIHLPAPGVTVVVGHNNAGKSTLLRQTVDLLGRNFGIPQEFEGWRLVSDITLKKEGDLRDAMAWFYEHSHYKFSGSQRTFNKSGTTIGQEIVREIQSGPYSQDRLSAAWSFIAYHADAWNRLSAVQPVEQRDHLDTPPSSPMHTMQDDPALFDRLNDLSKEVFKQPLTLDQFSRLVQLRVGDIEGEFPRVNNIPQEFRKEIARLPLLMNQGDGIKSLIGLILPLLSSSYKIALLDEPEAFLHPPQAGVLGRILGDISTEQDIQVVLATHDKNLLNGILQSGAPVSIVRLDRTEVGTVAHQLNVDQVKSLSNDPVLRYTNALDGLFHRLVVLAESDRDCRFYSASLEEFEPQTHIPIPVGEVLFVPSGGKEGLHKIAAALRSVHVPVAAIPDLDILNDEKKLKALVEALGGDWTTLEKGYRTCTAPFRESRDVVRAKHVLDAVSVKLKEDPERIYNARLREEVLAQLRAKDSPWKRLKESGQSAFPRGDAAKAASGLLDALDAIGLICVRVGELEGFAPTLNVRKGPEWLSRALEMGAHREREVREHIERLFRS